MTYGAAPYQLPDSALLCTELCTAVLGAALPELANATIAPAATTVTASADIAVDRRTLSSSSSPLRSIPGRRFRGLPVRRMLLATIGRLV
jgi:hypothetical protein